MQIYDSTALHFILQTRSPDGTHEVPSGVTLAVKLPKSWSIRSHIFTGAVTDPQ